MRAYLFVETRVGMAGRVAAKLGAVPLAPGRVVAVDTVTGPYDIIAVIEAPDSEAIGRAVSEKVHRIEGVEKTMTCTALSKRSDYA